MSNWRVVWTSERLEISATLLTQGDVDEVIRVIEFWKRLRWPLTASEPRVIGASGGRARAAAMDPQARSEQASKAAEARWHPKQNEEAADG